MSEKKDFFHIIEDSVCLLYTGGVYRQAKVYRRRNNVYAAYGGGFVLLCGHNGTSHPRVLWKELQADGVKIEGVKTPAWEG